jgi:DNA-binding transcriptional regulator YiaG
MLGAEFKTWRLSFGLSRRDLAKKIGVSRFAVKSWEIGKRKVPNYAINVIRAMIKH